MIKRKYKWNIKPRIFLMISCLIIVIFIAIFVSFNVVINNYIKSTVQSQLETLTYEFSQHEEKSEADAGKELPDISNQKKNAIGTHAEVFVIDNNYNILKYDEANDKTNLEDIANYLEEENTPLSNINNYFVQGDSEDYYISIVVDEKEIESYFVFFVNVTSIEIFIKTVNIILGIIMGVALLICFIVTSIITRSITNPIKELAKYAEQMGKVDFTPNQLNFTDNEFNKLAQIMNTSSEKLEEYDTAQRTFFQNASHELRTPLMSIKCYAEGISYNLMDKEMASKVILSETDRLSELVEELLYISKIDTINNSIEVQEMDLRETFSSCAEHLKSLAIKNNVEFIFDFDKCPVLFNYNEKYMERVFNNLISNALRYAKNEIILRCKKAEEITLSVINDGDKISDVDLPNIFDRFYKGENGKYGIGLSIVKSIVQLHNGKIVVHSDENQTEFKITF